MIRIIDSSKVLKRSKSRDRNFHRSFYESQIYLQIPSLNIQHLVQYVATHMTNADKIQTSLSHSTSKAFLQPS